MRLQVGSSPTPIMEGDRKICDRLCFYPKNEGGNIPRANFKHLRDDPRGAFFIDDRAQYLRSPFLLSIALIRLDIAFSIP